jgi:hypothetical protein
MENLLIILSFFFVKYVLISTVIFIMDEYGDDLTRFKNKVLNLFK